VLHIPIYTRCHATPDDSKKTVWLQARDHAWEAPTSFIMEGALKFIVSDDPAAKALREKNIFMFTPMVDPDGCAQGRVRFNANGWDLNRHWDDIDLRDPVWLQRLPEIWYYKKAIRDYVGTGKKIALMVNLHNTISEYMSARAPTDADVPRLQRLFDLLVSRTQFDPARPFQARPGFGRSADSTPSWWVAYGVPTALIETRIAPGKKLKGSPTAEHRYAFGRELLEAMAEAVQ
ncbi:MAG: M14 family zinc carboxypeptidase, partial [Verrucomicrobiota bacterium]